MKALKLLVLLLFTLTVSAPACLMRPASNPSPPSPTLDAPSCVGPDGQSRCGSNSRWNRTQAQLLQPRESHLLGGGTRPAIIPPSWTVSGWAVDGANSSTCASDLNNCTTTTCGAAGSFSGPCLTFNEIASRWGTYYPRLQQGVTITQMSSLPASDVVYLDPRMEGTTLLWKCSLGAAQQQNSTTLSSVTNKTRSSGTLASIVPTAGAISSNQLIFNTTVARSSHAWVSLTLPNTYYASSTCSPTACNVTQPAAGCTSPLSACAPAEDNSWAGTNTIVTYAPSNVTMVEVLPSETTSTQTATVPVVIVQGCAIQGPGTANTIDNGNLNVNANDQFVDNIIWSTVTDSQASGGNSGPQGVQSGGTSANAGFINCNFQGTPVGLAGATFYAGMIGRRTNGYPTLIDPAFHGDLEVFNYVVTKGSMAEQFNNGVTIADGLYIQFGIVQYGGYAAQGAPLWGGGGLFVEAGAFWQYPAGANQAVANFLQTGATPIRINDVGSACSHTNAAPDVVSCGITLTAAHLDAAQGAAGFGGYAYAPGGGTISNVNQ